MRGTPAVGEQQVRSGARDAGRERIRSRASRRIGQTVVLAGHVQILGERDQAIGTLRRLWRVRRRRGRPVPPRLRRHAARRHARLRRRSWPRAPRRVRRLRAPGGGRRCRLDRSGELEVQRSPLAGVSSMPRRRAEQRMREATRSRLHKQDAGVERRVEAPSSDRRQLRPSSRQGPGRTPPACRGAAAQPAPRASPRSSPHDEFLADSRRPCAASCVPAPARTAGCLARTRRSASAPAAGASAGTARTASARRRVAQRPDVETRGVRCQRPLELAGDVPRAWPKKRTRLPKTPSGEGERVARVRIEPRTSSTAMSSGSAAASGAARPGSLRRSLASGGSPAGSARNSETSAPAVRSRNCRSAPPRRRIEQVDQARERQPRLGILRPRREDRTERARAAAIPASHSDVLPMPGSPVSTIARIEEPPEEPLVNASSGPRPMNSACTTPRASHSITRARCQPASAGWRAAGGHTARHARHAGARRQQPRGRSDGA